VTAGGHPRGHAQCLIAGDARALWAPAAYFCVAWYVRYFATAGADDGILDGLILGLIALAAAGAAVGTGLPAGRLLR
jgi:hypothetical protein